MIQIDAAACEKLHSARAQTEEISRGKSKSASPFSIGRKGDFLELGIWILFVICYLVLGIFYIQKRHYF